MKMKFVFLSILLSSPFAFGATAVMATFGTDGATLEVSPNPDSAKQAAKLYEALNVKPKSTGQKEIGFEDAEIECSEPKQGIHTFQGNCSIAITPSYLVKMTESKMTFKGPLAEALFEALNGKTVARPGGTTKTAANLSCSVAFGARMAKSYSCTIKEANIYSF